MKTNISNQEYNILNRNTFSTLHSINREIGFIESTHLLRRTSFGPQIELVAFIKIIGSLGTAIPVSAA